MSEIHHVNDTLLTLSRQIERVMVKVESMESLLDEHKDKLEVIEQKFTKQETVINLFSKVSRLKPVGFAIGGFIGVVLVFGGVLDFGEHIIKYFMAKWHLTV